ncbi:TIGR03086 family metal-binding protein [Nocardioides alcanivorans]|uniref:TIGR03086 family metal-binding protein n=1 Tax=Nocardioides alcanivorans TaxID=2897352 RepID=UPI001F22BC3E|nr:TIGR03086 family metal-binding protein [Nocardioides alcanivorans]
MFDLGPATEEMKRLVSGVQEAQLGEVTPCSDWTVADLLAHVHQFATVFTDNAHKQPSAPPESLVPDWRVEIPRQLDALARAWAAEEAWHGRVSAGGIDMDAADNAVVAVEELTVHGWDLASATGQVLRVGPDQLDVIDRFLDLFASGLPAGQGPFGPVVAVQADASRLDLTLAQTGRDPSWSTAHH